MGAVKEAQSMKEGIYILQPNYVNGKQHWLQRNELTSNAIWWQEKKLRWRIGPLFGPGSSTVGILSYDSTNGPLEVTTWKYCNLNGDFSEATDQIILSAGIFIIIFMY